MLQLANTTGFTARLLVLPDRHGRDAALVVVKGAFSLRDGQRLSEHPPIIEADEWAGEPGASPLREASDIALEKPATDVVLCGSAYAPGGAPQATVEVSFSVGSMRKSLTVHGTRLWKKTWLGNWLGERPSPAAAFIKQPLEWAADDRVPPAIEDPQQPTGRRKAQRQLWGCGPVPATWESRRVHAGTYDAAWQRDRAPFLPVDFDPLFFQIAPPDQQVPGYLRGGEAIELVNCTPDGLRRAVVPTAEVRCQAFIGATPQDLPLRLDTVVLRPDSEQIDLTWRGLLPLGRKILNLTRVQIDG